MTIPEATGTQATGGAAVHDRSADPPAAAGYDPHAAEAKWQRYWRDHHTFRVSDDGARERRYVLDMFAYPSGDLHMGHAEAFAFGDAIARYLRLRGYDVLHPIGWDSFGLPAENAAIRHDAHPSGWTYANIETQARSFERYGLSLDWSRRLHTSDPEFYRWTQWLFLRFRERGLVHRKASPVNWCPEDQTVLANEQVTDGACERCGARVTIRELTQWYFRITEYADELLEGLDELAGRWPERVLTMQRNWIGRSAGAWVDFTVPGREDPVSVFTTRPDTIGGATFLVVAPDAPFAGELVTEEQRASYEAYRSAVAGRSERDRSAANREKAGVFTGSRAVNPITGEDIPVWVADYVLAGYGGGAVMAVPAHDQRDLDFALAHGLPVRSVIDTNEDPALTGVALDGAGAYSAPAFLTGVDDREAAISLVLEHLRHGEAGRPATTYRLRDWLVSRQRFWGCPIPVVHCPVDGEVPVPDAQLPVELPHLQGADLRPRGVSPLASATEWVETSCPECGGPASRDTDTMDTFVDSSWYFYRYTSPGCDSGPFDPEAARRWMPVDQYVGGAEHAILHLLYLRFVTRVLHDMGMVDFVEPINGLLNQGQVLNRGRAMSKSLGNGVDLGAQLDAHGVDAVRLAIVFAGPPEDDIDWADVSPQGMRRFLGRAHRLAAAAGSGTGSRGAVGANGPAERDTALRGATHRTIDAVTTAVESRRFNVAVARIMELVNTARRSLDEDESIRGTPEVREAAEAVSVMLSLFAPYVAEEMWETLGRPASVANAAWPEADPALLAEETVTCIVQIGGKVRARLEVAPDVSDDELEAAVLADENVLRLLHGAEIERLIIRAPGVASIVLR